MDNINNTLASKSNIGSLVHFDLLIPINAPLPSDWFVELTKLDDTSGALE